MAPRSIRHGPLRVSLPAGWFDASQVVAVGPEEAGFRANLVVSLEPAVPGESLERFAARMLEGVRTAEAFHPVSERKATFGANPGLLREYTFRLRSLALAQLQFYVLREEVAFTFTYTQLAHRLEATRADAESLLASVTLEPTAELALRPAVFRA
ncbi:DcrB-related protein [Corallococcus sp. RDP092CA]|uniref:DcrB-related protein n=1 Tax=Corallococcus sp. RDP092CA TaxID=3109369 RepID=UPI0035AFF3C6